MRLLIILLCVLSPLARGEEPLHLTLRLPNRVALGEPFEFRIELTNTSAEWHRVAPIFVPGPEYLTLELTAPSGAVLPAPSVAIDVANTITRDNFVLLGKDRFIGEIFHVSPAPEDSLHSFTGLTAGCHTLTVRLRLHGFGNRFQWDDGIRPDEASLATRGTICFTPPKRASIVRYRAALRSDDPEQRLAAYAYFSNVRDREAAEILVESLGKPTTWRTQVLDEYAVLKMIRRQCHKPAIEYVRQSVEGRYSAYARETLRTLTDGDCD